MKGHVEVLLSVRGFEEFSSGELRNQMQSNTIPFPCLCPRLGDVSELRVKPSLI